jgi:adenylate kinase family enzyme
VTTKVAILVGCPGSGKTTYAESLVRKEGYLHLSLDGMRKLIWGSKQEFWRQHQGGLGATTDILIPAYYETLRCILHQRPPGLVLDNTHITSYQQTLDFIGIFDAALEIVVFDIPLDFLLIRNLYRPLDDRLTEDVIRSYYEKHTIPDAWWRSHPHIRIGTKGEIL